MSVEISGIDCTVPAKIKKIGNVIDYYDPFDHIRPSWFSWPITWSVWDTKLAEDIANLPQIEDNKIVIEVPGFTKDDLTIELKDGDLIVTGKVEKDGYKKLINQYVYVGDVEVKSAKLVNGLLTIETEPVETLKKLITIE